MLKEIKNFAKNLVNKPEGTIEQIDATGLARSLLGWGEMAATIGLGPLMLKFPEASAWMVRIYAGQLITTMATIGALSLRLETLEEIEKAHIRNATVDLGNALVENLENSRK